VSTAALAHAAVVAARQLRVATIAVISDSGGAARLLSEYRPEAAIVAFSAREETFHRLALYWGVRPERAPAAASTEEMVAKVAAWLKQAKLAQTGERVIVTMGVPLGSGTSTNQLTVHLID
jgi:pyruvate kinase